MTLAWVVGSNGLLGTALSRTLQHKGSELFLPAERFCWDDEPKLATQIAAAVQAFAGQLGTSRRWEIYWAAGVGTMGSNAEAIAPETRALALLLKSLEAAPRLIAGPGGIAFASSAGAIYAGSSDTIITENTEPAPTTDYAREKLRQEEMVRTFAVTNNQATALLARISTLYGPGQARGKKQGLMTHIARSILRNQPIQIYVPYDTIRDYITAEDAAAATIATLRSTSEKPRVVTKIIASEHPATIAEIVSIFKRVARRKPRIVTSASRLSGLYARRVQFRSIVLAGPNRLPSQKLAIGIAQLMAAERAAYVQSSSMETK
jgi:UDP-glucose 4-epimerase